MSPSEPAARPRVAVMGAGAVGSYFGGMLARAGIDVTFIARPAHADAIQRAGLFMDTVTFQERVRAAAFADPAGARDADFVLFTVKTLQTEEAARLLAPNLKP
jgi:2-dehydropantoate 2-reductase